MARPYIKAKVNMKVKSLKSQLTMLMIIGLVLFIVISLVLYLSKAAIKKQSKDITKKIQETPMETQPIKDFVQKCLDKLAKDAVLLIGKQGGRIYKSQGGTLIDYLNSDEGMFFVEYGNLKTAYNILPPRFAPIPSPNTDFGNYYPWETFPYDPLDLTEPPIFEGYFGINNMPPLNPTFGSHSIQTQIETFIDNNIEKCIDINIFKEQGFDISVGKTNTSVIIGGKDVSVESKIPITIINSATNEHAELREFSTGVDVRIKDIYFFVRELIDKEVRDIKFNISSTKNNQDSFKIQLIKNTFSNDDLIEVSDQKSLLYGKPYEYAFGRKNRAPALYYIKDNVLEFEQEHKITESELIAGYVKKAEDPDEDSLAFSLKKIDGKPLPINLELDIPKLKFKLEVSDGKLSDYQIITVNRAET